MNVTVGRISAFERTGAELRCLATLESRTCLTTENGEKKKVNDRGLEALFNHCLQLFVVRSYLLCGQDVTGEAYQSGVTGGTSGFIRRCSTDSAASSGLSSGPPSLELGQLAAGKCVQVNWNISVNGSIRLLIILAIVGRFLWH
jgi:hypothetical protein